MIKPLEHSVEQKLIREVEKRGGRCLKLTSIKGIPDRLVLLPKGKAGFVETKKPGEKARKLQQVWIERLNKLGFPSFIYDGEKKVSEILDEIQSA